MSGSTATVGESRTSRLRRVPWWDVLFVLVPLIGVVWTWFSTFVGPEADVGRGATALGLIAAIEVAWFAFGRRHIGPNPRGYAAFAVITVLTIAAMTIVPVLGLLQGLLYPYLWTTLDGVRRSVTATFIVAVTAGASTVAFWGAEMLSIMLFSQVLSILLSIGVGLAMTTAWNIAEERQALVEELTRAHDQVRELSRQSGISLERERLSRELHDTLAQTLAGLSMLAERAARGARRSAQSGEGFDRTIDQLDQIADLAKAALAETRALIAESAPVHDEGGTSFEAAITRLAARFDRETDISLELELPDGELLDAIPRDHQVVLLRSLQEGLSNVRKHSDARRATVRIACDERGGGHDIVGHSLTITDDGRGFDEGRVGDTGFGLPGIRDRARLLDGTVAVDSSLGTGTSLRVWLPSVSGAGPRGTGGRHDDSAEEIRA